MKRIFALILTFLILGGSVTLAHAQANVPRKRTVWVPPPLGSHLGGGFVETGEVDNTSATNLATSKENKALAEAITQLDAKAKTVVEGWALMSTAVSWQTKVPVDVLKKQRATSGLTYAQLLVANSLATGAGKSFDQVLALRAKTGNWSHLAGKLHISLKSIVARLDAASESITYAEARRKLRREQNLKDSDFQRDGRSRDPRQG